MASLTEQASSRNVAHQPNQRSWRLLPVLLLLVGMLISWRLDVQHQQNGLAVREARFHTAATEVVNMLEQRLHSNVTILHGVASLFNSSEDVTRQEFASYVGGMNLDADYPGVQGVGFARWLPATEAPTLQAAMRASGFPDFMVHPATPKRPFYSTILYLEPFDWRNQRAFGYDMFSDLVRQKAMRRAVETGLPAMSGRITLVQETDEDVQAGFLIYFPIYKQGFPQETAAQRWDALLGWAYSPLRAGKLMTTVMAAGKKPWNDRFGLEVYADLQAAPEHLLYGSEPSGQRLVAMHEETLNLYGVDWLVRVTGSLNDDGTTEEESRRTLLLFGMALTLTVALLAQVILRSRQRIAAAYRETLAVNQQLQTQQAELLLAATVMEASPICILVADADHRVVSVNPAFSRITGYAPEEVKGQLLDSLSGRTGEEFDAVWNAVEATGRWEGELHGLRRDGSVYPQQFTLARVADPQGLPAHFVALLQDITERRQQEGRIRHLALHDYLTGLANRVLLLERAEQELLRARRYGSRPVVIFLDLDGFKPINDRCGHDAGDAVLIAVAKRLSAHLRDTDLVCRQGGDEFILLLPDHTDVEALLEFAEKLKRIVAEPIAYGEQTLSVEASIGIATYPRQGETVEELIKNADAAMYTAKGHASQRIWVASSRT